MTQRFGFYRSPVFPQWSQLLSDFDTALGHDLDRGFEVQENDEAFGLSVDVPGVRRENIKIDTAGRVLAIEAQRGERKFNRSFTLPDSVDVERIEAHLEDGVLRIALPKVGSAKTRTIEIQSGKPNFFNRLLGGAKEEVKNQ